MSNLTPYKRQKRVYVLEALSPENASTNGTTVVSKKAPVG